LAQVDSAIEDAIKNNKRVDISTPFGKHALRVNEMTDGQLKALLRGKMDTLAGEAVQFEWRRRGLGKETEEIWEMGETEDGKSTIRRRQTGS
jgi:hypothetical protein